jgi:hypothetical protein
MCPYDPGIWMSLSLVNCIHVATDVFLSNSRHYNQSVADAW